MIVRPPPTTGAKVAGAQLMFAHHNLHAALLQQRQVKPAAEIAVGQHHVPFPQRAVQCAKQAVFAGLLALVLADRGIDHRADSQREHHHHPGNGKSTARLLCAQWRIFRLILRCVGHRDGRAVDIQHAASQPAPSGRSVFVHVAAGMPHPGDARLFG